MASYNSQNGVSKCVLRKEIMNDLVFVVVVGIAICALGDLMWTTHVNERCARGKKATSLTLALAAGLASIAF